ncbi:hypothetical protein IW150_003334 [Coemansia sp. RSA 2607]|nr:hypothetical protein IW150_003334 [Coemansia sp. RSA 2607]
MDERGERELNTLSDKKARTMTGSVVASLAHLKDINGNDGAFFVFPDLSVRCEGVYRLKFSLFEIVGNQVFFCKSITSTKFTVFSAKKFPGMEESTRLTKLFAEQGLKIRVRKEQKSVRPKGNRSRMVSTTMLPDGVSPSGQQPLLSSWSVDHRQPISSESAYSGHHMHQQAYSGTMGGTLLSPSMAVGIQQSRPTPPGTWNNPHMQHHHQSVALSQSPQLPPPPPLPNYVPGPDIQHQQHQPHSEADVSFIHGRHPRHQNQNAMQRSSPGIQAHYRGSHRHQQQQQQQHPSGYHHSGANPMISPNPATISGNVISSSVHTPGSSSHAAHSSAHPPRTPGASQILPPIHHARLQSGGSGPSHSQHPADRRPSYTRDTPQQSTNNGGDYFDSPTYSHQQMMAPSQTYPHYRPTHMNDEGGRSQAHQQFAQHRPWSPHHRAQHPHHHQSPTHAGSSFIGDPRYSPYNRQVDPLRDPRQHMPSSVRISTLVSSTAGDTPLPGYQEQQPRNHSHIQSLPNLRVQQQQQQLREHGSRLLQHSTSSSAPDTPSGPTSGTNLQHQSSPQVHGHGHQYYPMQQQQSGAASSPPLSPHGEPSKSSSLSLVTIAKDGAGRSSTATNHPLPTSSSAPTLAQLHSPTAPAFSPNISPAASGAPQLAQMSSESQPTQQRRIAVHSLLISDSSSPERVNGSSP